MRRPNDGVEMRSPAAADVHLFRRADALRSEREATGADLASPDVAAEEGEWEAVLSDGLL